jgi:glutamate racemase
VFDSGVGGLTVVSAIMRRFPNERILYLADQSHVPYGGRPLEEIKQFATGISTFLAGEGCRAIIMACNISSAVALSSVREAHFPLPVFGMIEAAARAATAGDKRIGVLATLGTVTSGAYSAQVKSIRPDAEVIEIPCPRFVPLVESGDLQTREALDACREYLTPLALAGFRNIILGCTHYPYLLSSLQRVACEMFDGDVTFVDPAEELAAALPIPSELSSSTLRLLTTGDSAAFRSQIPLFLPNVDKSIANATWDRGRLFSTTEALAGARG